MRMRSIRLRLTLWYAGSVFLLLLATTLGARALVRQSLEEEFARSQETAAALVRGFFRVEIAEYLQIVPTLEHISGELVIADRHIDFVRPDGADFAPRSTVRVMPLPDLAPPVREVLRPLDPGLAPGWGLRITSSAAPLARQQRQVDRWAALAVPFAVGVAVLAGWVLTGRTLRPVAAMADAADRISADASGRLPVASADDELGRLGLRFNAVLDRLDQALAHQRRFLADAAHELRTPLARARGAGELALASAADAAGDRAALGRMQAELEAMSHLVDELLELARADADRRPAALRRGYLDDVAADAVRAFEPLARRAGVRLELDAPEEASVWLEEHSLGRLVAILLDNAVRYSDRGGTVRVRVAADPTGPQLEVEDEGIGIPPEERTRLFERFFRGAGARRLAPDGSGLGLPIAAAIAERHRASMVFAPGVPRGTRVVVRFPPAS